MTLIILLFAIGIFLLAAEVLVPGGILGLAGGVLLFCGCAVAFVRLGPMHGLVAIAATVVIAIVVFYVEFKVLPHTRLGKRFFLRSEVSGSSSALKGDARDLIGKTATSVTVLSPSGYVSVDGERYDAYSQSGQIAPGTELEVIAANSFQLTVRTKS